MLNFKRIKFNSSQKVEIFNKENNIFTIYIEYYDKSNLELITNLEILHIKNELLPVHYKFTVIKNNYIKKVIIFSRPKKLDITLESLNVNLKDLENIYRAIKELNKNSNILEITLLVNTNTQEILYTFDKVYKKEFQWFNKANYKEDLILVILRLHLLYFYPILLYNLNILFYI